MKKKKYWYKITHWECPLCGRGPTYRERVYKKSEAGHYEEADYDYCDQ